MATTTPNFGWPVPTSTDLVKDGAVAIEGLGDAIDASLLDLKGGTTGQVLAKASGTDMDFSWVAQDDSNAIQNAIVDAKGDLIGATAADTPARLAVGTNGQVLTADSTAATGLAWATPSTGSTFVGCVLKNDGTQSIANSTYTNVTFNLENIDTNGFHSTVTNTDRITIPVGYAGKYRFTAQVRFDSNSSGYRRMDIEPTGGGSSITNGIVAPVNGSGTAFTTTAIFDCAEGDYFTLAVLQTSGGSLNLTSGSSGTALAATVFSAEYLGA
jgi:hypothetical protein